MEENGRWLLVAEGNPWLTAIKKAETPTLQPQKTESCQHPVSLQEYLEPHMSSHFWLIQIAVLLDP